MLRGTFRLASNKLGMTLRGYRRQNDADQTPIRHTSLKHVTQRTNAMSTGINQKT